MLIDIVEQYPSAVCYTHEQCCVCRWVYGKAGNGNEMETGNKNGKAIT